MGFGLTTILLLVVGTYLLWCFSRRQANASEPPIVHHWIPWLGSALDYQKNPIKFLRRCTKAYGPIFTVHMGGRYFTFVTDPLTLPLIAKESKRLNFRILTIPTTKKIFDFQRRGVEKPTGDGIFVKYMQGKSLEDLMAIMMKNLLDVTKAKRFSNTEWNTAGLLDLTYDIIFPAGFKAIFGDYAPSSGKMLSEDKMKKIINQFIEFDQAFPLLAQGYPISYFKGLKECRERFWNLLSVDEVNERENVHDIISAIVRSMQQDDLEEDIPKQLLGILFAAESNTVLAGFWCLYYLLKHPEAREAVCREVSDTLKENSQTLKENSCLHVTRTDLAKMTTLDSAVKECLRLRVSPSMLRYVTEDMDLGVKSTGRMYRLRKGDSLLALYGLTHMDPEIYDNPEAFQYDRFLNADKTEKQDFFKNGEPVRFYWQAFGSGLSKCPGRYFAMAEVKQFLILMLLRFDVEMVDPSNDPGYVINRTAFGALPPTSDITVRFRRKTFTEA